VNEVGELYWSNGLTSKIDGGLCSKEVAVEAPSCPVRLENWLGQPARTFNNGNPNEITDEVMLVAAGPNKYCFVGRKMEPTCFTWDGSQLESDTQAAELTETGDFRWLNGPWTTRLYSPCLVAPKCPLSLKNLRGTGRSWWTSTNQPGEDLHFSVNHTRLRINGTKSGLNYYRLHRQKLIHERKPWRYATLTATGELRWSHGFTSKIDGDDVCRKIRELKSKCKLRIEFL
jgi:hypothetical protein